jgi:hypothetical protein
MKNHHPIIWNGGPQRKPPYIRKPKKPAITTTTTSKSVQNRSLQFGAGPAADGIISVARDDPLFEAGGFALLLRAPHLRP